MHLLTNPVKIWRGLFPCVFALTLTLSGCREPGPAAVPATGENESGAPLAEAPLVILTWDEYFSPEVVANFEKEHGIDVEFVTFSNLDEMDGLLRSRPSDFDLLVASGGVVADLVELQLLQPVSRDMIPLFGNLDDQFLGLKFDPGNQYSVPYMWGTTMIAYRSDKIPEPAKSWKALWEESFRSRVLMLDDGFDTYAAALLAAGHDLNSQDPKQLEEATGMLLEQVDKLDARFVDIFEVRDKLLSGECWISMTYSSDASVLAEEEENIDYFIPEEGAPLWVDSFVIPRESRNSHAAHLFLDYLCRAEVAAANSNELWCASVNREARPYLSKEILEDPSLYLDPSVMARCKPESQSSPTRQLQVNQGLKRVYDRVRESEAKPSLSLLIWEEYLAPSVMERFTKESGARVVVTEVENSEQLKQALGSKPDAYDVVVADEKTLTELIHLRLLRELDPEKLNLRTARNELLLASAPDPGNRYLVPYLWGLTVLAGREEALRGVDPSWSLIWRKDLRVALLDEPQDIMWMALLGLGYDPATATTEQLDEASARLADRFPDFSGAMMDMFSALDALEAGELDLVMSYNGDALRRAAEIPGLQVIVPKEGAPLWLDSFAITRDAPNPCLAHRFIDFMTTPEISALTASELNYATPNPEALAMVSPSLLAEPALYPQPELLEKCGFVQFPTEMLKYTNQSMLRMISESRTRMAAAESVPSPAIETEESPTED